jgi:hypothetical protein
LFEGRYHIESSSNDFIDTVNVTIHCQHGR